jgi:hypothetical protein
VGEGSTLPEMKDLTSTTFGYLIAFLLPGIFGLYALSYWFPAVGVILQPVLKADATVGPSVVFLSIAVGMGLCLGAVRSLIFEKLLCRKHHFPPDMFALLYKENKLTAFKAVVDEHYRYHQFYGGSGVAFLILFVGWLDHYRIPDCQLVYLSVGFVLVELLLGYAACDTFIKYIKRGCTIVSENPVTKEEPDK